MQLAASAQQVQNHLTEVGHPGQVVMFSAAARTAAQAAEAIGCDLAQIAKSLIFATASGAPVLVIASGANRVSEELVAALVGEPIGKASAAQVREWTGYAIGGVPPFAHRQPIATLIDTDLTQYAEIWAAAGHPHAVFPLTPADLVRLSGGQLAQVKQSPSINPDGRG
jgi:prolyl-tRNA editing enzyme YbaK/EbsC (Cys-tRNA(Pro) deacylase)